MATATVLAGVGVALGALQTLQSGLAASAEAKSRAQFLEQDAAIAQQQAALQEDQARRDSERQRGSLRARAAKSGVKLQGSPLLAIEEEAVLGELDALSARYGGNLRARDARAEASLTAARGRNQLTNSLLGAGASLANFGADQLKE